MKVTIRLVTLLIIVWPLCAFSQDHNTDSKANLEMLKDLQGLENQTTRIDSSIISLTNTLRQRIDSLTEKGNVSQVLKARIDSLDSISGLPNEQYNKLLSLQQEFKDSIRSKLPLANIGRIKDEVQKSKTDVNDLSKDIRIGPLDQDTGSGLNSKFPNASMPDLPPTPKMETSLAGENLEQVNVDLPEAPGSDGLNNVIPETEIKSINEFVPDGINELKGKASDVTSAISEVSGVVKDGEQYIEEIKAIQNEGLTRSEKMPELAEQQLLKIDEVSTLQQQKEASIGQMEEYKDMIEQYKSEQEIKKDLEKRTRELANDVIAQNQKKVDASMSRISRAKQRFSQVHDARKLPKRPTNPVKGAGWRERLIPGFTFYTFTADVTWLQFDPQLLYRLDGRFSAGGGVITRLSMNVSQPSLGDFNALKGVKLVTQFDAYKGFSVKAEGQRSKWNSVHLPSIDPPETDRVWTIVAGISKSYPITKRLKGNAETLYHYSWGFDPYKTKIIIRIGFNWSLKKNPPRAWKEKLRQARKMSRSNEL